MRVTFETPRVGGLCNAEPLPSGGDWPGGAQLIVVLYEFGDPNPIGASGSPTAKPLSHNRRQHRDLSSYTVPPSRSIRGEGAGAVTNPPHVFAGLADSARDRHSVELRHADGSSVRS